MADEVFSLAVELVNAKSVQDKLDALIKRLKKKGLDLELGADLTEVRKKIDEVRDQIQKGANFDVGTKDLQRVDDILEQIRLSETKVKESAEETTQEFHRQRDAARGVGNTAQKAQIKTSLASQNVLRIIQDARFGMFGVANNIEQLAESTARLRSQTGSLGRALKATFMPLVAGPMALAFIVTLLVQVAATWDDITAAVNRTKGTIEGLTSAQIAFDEATAELQKKDWEEVYGGGAAGQLREEIRLLSQQQEQLINRGTQLNEVFARMFGGSGFLSAFSAELLEMLGGAALGPGAGGGLLENLRIALNPMDTLNEEWNEAQERIDASSTILEKRFNTLLKEAVKRVNNLNEGLDLRQQTEFLTRETRLRANLEGKVLDFKLKQLEADRKRAEMNQKVRSARSTFEGTLDQAGISGQAGTFTDLNAGEISQMFGVSRDEALQIQQAALNLQRTRAQRGLDVGQAERAAQRLQDELAFNRPEAFFGGVRSLTESLGLEFAGEQVGLDAASIDFSRGDQIVRNMLRRMERARRASLRGTRLVRRIQAGGPQPQTLAGRLQQSQRQERSQLTDVRQRFDELISETEGGSERWIQLHKQRQIAVTEIQRNWQEKRERMQEQHQQQQIESISGSIGQLSSAADTIFNAWVKRRKQQLKEQGKTEQQITETIRKEGRRRFAFMKRLKVATAITDTLATGLAALRQTTQAGTGNPLAFAAGIAQMGAALATGYAQVRKIQAMTIGGSIPGGSSGGGRQISAGRFTQLNQTISQKRQGIDTSVPNVSGRGGRRNDAGRKLDEMNKNISKMREEMPSEVTIDEETSEKAMRSAEVRRKSRTF